MASARRTALALALKLGFNEEDWGAVAVIATEAASNLVKHGGGGDLIVRDATFGARRLLEVIAIDRGRGMTSIARCFEDGYSTAGQPGHRPGGDLAAVEIARCLFDTGKRYRTDRAGGVPCARRRGVGKPAGDRGGSDQHPVPG